MKIRKTSKRVILNRRAFGAIRLGAADGMHQIGVIAINRAEPNVPDRPPYGKGLVQTGRVATYLDGKLVAGAGRPPGGKIPKRGIVTVFGFGFPAFFLEIGTEFIEARPFFTPATASAVPQAGPLIAENAQKRYDRA